MKTNEKQQNKPAPGVAESRIRIPADVDAALRYAGGGRLSAGIVIAARALAEREARRELTK